MHQFDYNLSPGRQPLLSTEIQVVKDRLYNMHNNPNNTVKIDANNIIVTPNLITIHVKQTSDSPESVDEFRKSILGNINAGVGGGRFY